MRRGKKVMLAGAGCIGAGIVLTAAGAMAGGTVGMLLDSSGIHMAGDAREEAHILEKTELPEFTSADIAIDSGDFRLAASDGYYLEYSLDGNHREPEYGVENGTFVFSEASSVNLINLGLALWETSDAAKNQVTLYVPEMIFEEFALKNSYGDADLGSLSGKSVKISLESGDLKAETIEAQDLSVSNSYGDVKIENGKADTANLSLESGNLESGTIETRDLSVSGSYGDLAMENCKAETADFELESGDAVVNIAEDIAAYDIELNTESGQIYAPEIGTRTGTDDEEKFRFNAGGEKKLTISSSYGDIHLSNIFEK